MTLLRLLFGLIVATGLTAGCSREAPSESTASGQKPHESTSAAQKAPEPAASTPAAPASGNAAALAEASGTPAPAAQPQTAGPAPDSPTPSALAPESSGVEPSKPEFEVTIPAGRSITVRLSTRIASDERKPEQTVAGSIVGGGKGAAIGAGAGGAGTVLATRGKEVELPAGTTLTTTLQAPLTIMVPVPAAGDEQ